MRQRLSGESVVVGGTYGFSLFVGTETSAFYFAAEVSAVVVVTPEIAVGVGIAGLGAIAYNLYEAGDTTQKIFEAATKIGEAKTSLFDYLFSPTPDGGDDGDDGDVEDADSEDPNSLLGPAGYGSSNFVADAGTSSPTRSTSRTPPPPPPPPRPSRSPTSSTPI